MLVSSYLPIILPTLSSVSSIILCANPCPSSLSPSSSSPSPSSPPLSSPSPSSPPLSSPSPSSPPFSSPSPSSPPLSSPSPSSPSPPPSVVSAACAVSSANACATSGATINSNESHTCATAGGSSVNAKLLDAVAVVVSDVTAFVIIYPLLISLGAVAVLYVISTSLAGTVAIV